MAIELIYFIVYFVIGVIFVESTAIYIKKKHNKDATYLGRILTFILYPLFLTFWIVCVFLLGICSFINNNK